jgi:hypothetical protein
VVRGCAATRRVLGVAAGFGFGTGDSVGDLTFYKYTSDAASSVETFGFTNDARSASVVMAVSIRSR